MPWSVRGGVAGGIDPGHRAVRRSEPGPGWARKARAFLAWLPSSMALAFDGWQERRRLRLELDALGERGELDRMLMDSGISRRSGRSG
jgi:hypothetical protein